MAIPKIPEIRKPKSPRKEFPKNSGGILAIIRMEDPMDKAAMIMA